MAGESTILDTAFDNVAGVNFQPYQVAVVDATNSGTIVTAATTPGGALAQPLGVVYDKAKLDASNNPVANSGANIRLLGIARVVANGAITPGAFVSVSGTNGRVQAQTQAGAGVQPKPVLGIALNQAGAAGDRIVVLLTPGVQY